MLRFDPFSIARLEEARQAASTAASVELALRSDPKCSHYCVEPCADGSMCFAGFGSWWNQACGLGLHGEVSGQDIDRMIDFYVSRGVEPKIEVASL